MAALYITAVLAAAAGFLHYTATTPTLRTSVGFLLMGADPALNSAPLSTDLNHKCHPYELIFARGSLEPLPLGFRVGPRLKSELHSRIPREDLLVVGLDWQANFEIPVSPANGTAMMVQRVKHRAEMCPGIQFSLAGYSQGADVIHQALQQLATFKHQISSILVFGDPLTSVGWPVYYAHAGRVLNSCDPRDRACGGRGLWGHVRYGKKAKKGEEANDFISMATQFAAAKFEQGFGANGEATLKRLPPPGEGAKFLRMWKKWPPEEWKKYSDGVKVTMGLF